MNGRNRVLVAMSGGVDSSVAACLLAEQGHDVVGVFMRVGGHEALASGDDGRGDRRQRGCCSAEDASDARRVAGMLDIPFYALNFQDDFSRLIDYFADEYARARTPNPCVMCNQWLKFGKLLRYAEIVEADWVATGHYARIVRDEPDGERTRPRLLRARDRTKDQSYVLFGLSPAALRRTLFPIGDLTKDEVRSHARRLGLPLADKPESQDICFVPDGDYARVVRARRPDAFRSGAIRHEDGRVLGGHGGLANFTIGQRRGVGVAAGSPIYVTGLDAGTATVTVGARDDLLSDTAAASSVNWLIKPPGGPIRADVQIRYHHDAAPAAVHPQADDRVRVLFDVPQPAVTPGQAMVFYSGDEVLGGGWIDGGGDDR